jgi:hypothetical protein
MSASDPFATLRPNVRHQPIADVSATVLLYEAKECFDVAQG